MRPTLPSCASDSGVLRRIVYVIYTDCIRQCSGPMYIVSDRRETLALSHVGSLTILPSVSLWQDRMVLLVMGNIVNWSL